MESVSISAKMYKESDGKCFSSCAILTDSASAIIKVSYIVVLSFEVLLELLSDLMMNKDCEAYLIWFVFKVQFWFSFLVHGSSTITASWCDLNTLFLLVDDGLVRN